MRSCSTKCFVINIFTNGSFNQITSGKENTSSFIHNHRFIAHDRKIRATSNTTSHNGCNLGNSHTAHDGIVSKYTSKMLFVWKNFILHWQINSSRINQINYWQAVFHRNFLCAKIFFGGNWKPSTSFYGSIISNNNTLFSFDITHFYDDATGRTTTMFGIHPISNKRTNFYAFGFIIKQIINTFASCHFAFGM